MKEAGEFIPTRESLLSRLKDWNDEESWRVFFDTYWKLIYNAGIKAGLTDAEAQDVVQETLLSVSKSMPRFQYDAEKGSFKNWLMRLTGWRINDQLRKRGPGMEHSERSAEISSDTPTLERVADPIGLRLEALWDEEWERNLMEAAIARVRRKVDPEQYQVFDLYALKGWPAAKVARTLRINPARVYLIKHRINHLVKKEIARLQTQPI
jgi:RNA polymerase sigma-70 factor (ECF subfamily)